MGLLFPRAGHPTHSLCSPSGTWDVSPPWQGHVRTTCLSGLQKGPESSLVANHCLRGGHGESGQQCGIQHSHGPGIVLGCNPGCSGWSEAALVWFCGADADGKGFMSPPGFPEPVPANPAGLKRRDMLLLRGKEAPAQNEVLPLTLLCVSKPQELLKHWESPQFPPQQCRGAGNSLSWSIYPTSYI